MYLHLHLGLYIIVEECIYCTFIYVKIKVVGGLHTHTFPCQALLWEMNAIWEDFNLVSNVSKALDAPRFVLKWCFSAQTFRFSEKKYQKKVGFDVKMSTFIRCITSLHFIYNTSVWFHCNNWKAQERVTVSTSQTSTWEAWFSTVFLKRHKIGLLPFEICAHPYCHILLTATESQTCENENKRFYLMFNQLCYFVFGDIFQGAECKIRHF